MRDSYDCVVVGPGPGGSLAARHAAEGGASVLLLEKDTEVGLPVRCGEAVNETGLRHVVEIEPRWVSTVLQGAVIVSPAGHEVVIEAQTDRGLILDREVFDRDLARQAEARGAELVTRAYVSGLVREDGQVTGVRVEHAGRVREIRAQVVIGADGIESRVGRWAGLATHTRLGDLGSCYQMTLEDIRVDPRYAWFLYGREVAPGGYAWIFPKSDRAANVGLGVGGTEARHRPAWRLLRQFVARRFPGAKARRTVCGGVPCARTLSRIASGGLMLVGDAAHQANPVSGGGIVPAMLAGMLAGREAARAVAEGDVSVKRLARYARSWHEFQGKTHERAYRVKQALYRLSDGELDGAALAFLALAPEKRTLVNLFRAALVRRPLLFLDIARCIVLK
jgi:digeranylgeranylglycerophospholipid reductase